jgi:hypothetical protein
LHLRWAEGEGFAVVDTDARDSERTAKAQEALEWIVAFVTENPGLARSRVEAAYVSAADYKGARSRAREAIDAELEVLAAWKAQNAGNPHEQCARRSPSESHHFEGQTASLPRLATTNGEQSGGTYLIPFTYAASPLAKPLFGEPGETPSDPESGGGFADSPPPIEGGE